MTMLNALSPLIDLVYLVVLAGIAVGGVLAVRKGQNKETQEAMKTLNETLDGEITALRRRVDDLEKERATQDRVIATIRYALKQYRLKITISGDVVTIHAPNGTSQSVPVQDRAQIKPILTGTSEDEDA